MEPGSDGGLSSLCQKPIAHPEVKWGEKNCFGLCVSAFLELLLGSGGEEPGELHDEKKQVRAPGVEPGSASVQHCDLELLGTISHICEMTHRVILGPLM